MSSELDILQRKLNREVRARKAAEALLEEKAQELWESNQKLQFANEKLDLQVKSRTEILVKNYNRLSTVVNTLESAVLIEDEKRKVIFVNEAYCTLFQSTVAPSSFRGMSCESFLHIEKLQMEDEDDYIKFIITAASNRRTEQKKVFQLRNKKEVKLLYTPFFNETSFIGQMWHWKEIKC